MKKSQWVVTAGLVPTARDCDLPPLPGIRLRVGSQFRSRRIKTQHNDTGAFSTSLLGWGTVEIEPVRAQLTSEQIIPLCLLMSDRRIHIFGGMANGVFYAHFACNPFFNMAFDEWMFQRALSQPASLHLRLYSWQPGGITFGVNQRQETALDFSKVGDTPVIRRITGGRALYHDPSELTYCVAVNCDGWANTRRFGSISSASAELSEVLMVFLSKKGINTERVKPSLTGGKEAQMLHTAPCFASNARHEIISDGKKIIASAQRQIDNVILQHGAIKINGIASHPALSSKIAGVGQRKEIQSLTESKFKSMSQPFCDSFSEYFGVGFDLASVGESEQNTVFRAAEKLKKIGLERRKITKHTNAKISL